MLITLTGVKPYDGTYKLDFGEELTTREFGWIKRLAGYLPEALENAGGDPEFACALAVIALHRAGRVTQAEVPAVFEKLIDAPFGSTVTINTEDEPLEEGDARPPTRSSNGNDSSSGTASRPSSETLAQTRPGSGIPGWDISGSGPPTSAA